MRTVLRKLSKLSRTVGKQTDFTWRYMLNLGPTVSYAMAPETLSAEARRVVTDLNRDGVAVSSVDKLLSRGREQLVELAAAVSQREYEIAPQIETIRHALATGTRLTQKTYVLGLLPDHGSMDARDPYTRFAMREPIPQIANAYYGMHVSLRYRNVWRNFVTDQPPLQSQLWHRDPEDRHILKVFVYLSDVTAGTGPLTYAAGTHMKVPLRRLPAFSSSDGGTPRSTDEQMAEVVPAHKWVT